MLTLAKKAIILPFLILYIFVKEAIEMKKTNSIGKQKKRDIKNRVVRRRDGKGKVRLFVINPDNPRMKAKQ